MTMTTSATQFTKESECAAEGVGSILKFLASTSNLSPARVVGKTLMKFYGLAGDGSDDQFLERVWRSMGKCSFNFAHARARQCRYRLGHGSKTLRRMLKASAARKDDAKAQIALRVNLLKAFQAQNMGMVAGELESCRDDTESCAIGTNSLCRGASFRRPMPPPSPREPSSQGSACPALARRRRTVPPPNEQEEVKLLGSTSVRSISPPLEEHYQCFFRAAWGSNSDSGPASNMDPILEEDGAGCDFSRGELIRPFSASASGIAAFGGSRTPKGGIFSGWISNGISNSVRGVTSRYVGTPAQAANAVLNGPLADPYS
ncbi:unnamed protein product, partial [Polarella glacialis]